MKKALIIYSTVDGQTKKICQRISTRFEAQQYQVECCELAKVPLDLASFDKIILGASIRYGKHRPEVAEFLEANREVLEQKQAAFFSVNVVARKPNKNTPETNPYMVKFLATLSWKPKNLMVFAGFLDFSKYGFFDKHMIRFIMWLTKGPTALDTKIDYTDWDKVDQFGDQQAAN